MHNLQN